MTIKTIKQIAKELIENKIKKEKIENYLEENEFMFNDEQLKLIIKEFNKIK